MMLWPNVMKNGANAFEQSLAEKMVLLPIDQRYKKEDMEFIAKSVICFENLTRTRKK